MRNIHIQEFRVCIHSYHPMARRAADYPDRIETFHPAGTRTKLVAIAYHMGASGEYATPVRNIISRGIRDYVINLKGPDLKDFQEILQNVEIQMKARADIKQKTPT